MSQLAIEFEAISESTILGFHQVLDSVARERKYIALLEAPPLEKVERSVKRGIENGMPRFIALKNGKVIGWCDIRLNEIEGFTHRGELGMGVLKAYRYKGVGTGLLRLTLDRAREISLSRVELDVYASNNAAIALYKKFGFQTEAIQEKTRFLDGKYDNIVKMVLFLDD